MKRLFLLLLAVTVVACQRHGHKLRLTGRIAESAMVVSAHPLASKAGADILRKGGNAVDAAIATQFALAVVYPAAGNIGGGGFMVLRLADGTRTTLDYRERAPALATENMYLSPSGEVLPDLSVSGHLACGVPGTIAGLWEAHNRYGKLAWKDLVQPAIDLALKGITLTEHEANGLNSIQQALRKYNTVLPDFLIRDSWSAGDSVRYTDLGHTLEFIRDKGKAGFYEGKTADNIVAEMQRGHGLISHTDLKNYVPAWRVPLVGTYRGHTIIAMPPPSSGGVALLQLLESVEPYPLSEWGHNSVAAVHLLTEAERRAYADRSVYLGDPDFVTVPVDKLVDKTYVTQRMKSFNASRATPSLDIHEGAISLPESEQTTHLSIVDAGGNAVSVTTTLNGSYGSKVVVGGSGFLLNNEMDDFSAKPGVPNMYGAVGGMANKIEPGKRMLSSMTPTIVERDGKLYMVVGTPGGTTIITSVFQTIMNVVDHDMTMQEAVSTGRIHSQWLPDEIVAEERALDSARTRSLKALGHTIRWRKGIGRVDAILVRPDGKLEGGADPRGDDAADGF